MTAALLFERASAAPVPDVLAALGVDAVGGGANRMIRCPSPTHKDSRPSASIEWSSGLWNCFGCGSRGSLSDLAAAVRGTDATSAAQWLADGFTTTTAPPAHSPTEITPAPELEIGPTREPQPDELPELAHGGRLVARWPIRRADGDLVAVHLRYESGSGKKAMPWWRNGSRQLGFPAARLPLYGSELLEDDGDDGYDLHRLIVVCEGEKATDAARSMQLPAVGTVTGANGLPCSDSLSVLRGRDVVVWRDADEAGAHHASALELALNGVARSVVTWCPPDAAEGADAADFAGEAGHDPGPALLETFQGLLDRQLVANPSKPGVDVSHSPSGSPGSGPRVWSGGEFVSADLTPAPWLVEGLIRERELAMLFAAAGTGKTTVSLALVVALVTGSPFLRWSIPRPRRVLLIDGEMASWELQSKIAGFAQGADVSNLSLIAADTEESPLPTLWADSAQHFFSGALEGVDLVVIDSLSTVFGLNDENAAKCWEGPQSWLLAQRRAGRSVVFLHHAGKSGTYRGTSRMADVPNLIIQLDRPDDYRTGDGCRFVWSMPKTRGLHGKSVAPLEVSLSGTTERPVLEWVDAADTRDSAIAAAIFSGVTSPKDISKTTGIPLPTVYRRLKRLKEEGSL